MDTRDFVSENLFKKQGVDVKLESSEIKIGVEQAENNEFVSFDKTGITEGNIEDFKYLIGKIYRDNEDYQRYITDKVYVDRESRNIVGERILIL